MLNSRTQFSRAKQRNSLSQFHFHRFTGTAQQPTCHGDDADRLVPDVVLVQDLPQRLVVVVVEVVVVVMVVGWWWW